VLAAGDIAGVTVGSRFAGYSSGGDALDEESKPLVTAYVEATFADRSTLKLDAVEEPESLPEKLTWRQTSRGAGDDPLRVAIYPRSGEATDAAAAMLDGLGYVDRDQTSPDLALYVDQPGVMRIARVEDADTITTMAADDTARLDEVLGQISKYRNLIALNGAGSPLNVEFKLDTVDCRGRNPTEAIEYVGAEAHFVAEQDVFYFKIRNKEGRPLYPHLINLTSEFGIGLVGTRGDNADEDFIRAGGCFAYKVSRLSGDGRDHMLLVMSERSLPGLRNLASPEITTRAAFDPLENIISRAAVGLRSAGGPTPAGDWSVQAITYIIKGATE